MKKNRSFLVSPVLQKNRDISTQYKALDLRMKDEHFGNDD